MTIDDTGVDQGLALQPGRAQLRAAAAGDEPGPL
jgi:hypothetical protein